VVVAVCFDLGRRNIPCQGMQTVMVEAIDPFQGGQFKHLTAFPGGVSVDEFGLVQTVVGLKPGRCRRGRPGSPAMVQCPLRPGVRCNGCSRIAFLGQGGVY